MRKGTISGFVAGFIFLATILLAGIPPSLAYEKQIRSLSALLAEQINTAGKKTIAVVDFTDLQGNVTELGRFLAEEFSVALAGASKGFEVIDRTHLKSIMAEHKLTSKGIIDPQTARKLGKITGVGTLITGTITPFGDSVRLSVKVLDTETARMISASTGNIAKTDAVEELLGKGIQSQKSEATRITTYKSAPGKAQQTAEAGGFVFTLQECKLTGQTIACSMLITSKGKDKELKLYDNTRIFDEFGNEYEADHLQLANAESDYRVSKLLISNVPTKGKLLFKEVQPAPKYIALLNIYCRSFHVKFRNIPVQRK